MRLNGTFAAATAAALALALALGACARPWYGYTREEWRQLSADEQAAARAEYEFIIDQREAQNHEDQIEDRKQSIIDYGTRVPKQRKLKY